MCCCRCCGCSSSRHGRGARRPPALTHRADDAPRRLQLACGQAERAVRALRQSGWSRPRSCKMKCCAAGASIRAGRGADWFTCQRPRPRRERRRWARSPGRADLLSGLYMFSSARGAGWPWQESTSAAVGAGALRRSIPTFTRTRFSLIDVRAIVLAASILLPLETDLQAHEWPRS